MLALKSLTRVASASRRGIRTVPNVVNGKSFMVDDVSDNFNPATGKVVAHIAASTKADVEGAIEGAHDAFEHSGWANASFDERAAVVNNIGKGITARIDEFAAIESADTGKPLHVAKAMDIDRTVHNFEFFAGYASHMPHSCQPVTTGLHYTQTKPLGVVSLITPWNLPLYLLTWKLAPALMMGNTCVAKPASNTPSSASLLAEVCLEAGLPPGVFNVVQGRGSLAGDAMVTHPLVKAVSFTGDSPSPDRVGRDQAGSGRTNSAEPHSCAPARRLGRPAAQLHSRTAA